MLELRRDHVPWGRRTESALGSQVSSTASKVSLCLPICLGASRMLQSPGDVAWRGASGMRQSQAVLKRTRCDRRKLAADGGDTPTSSSAIESQRLRPRGLHHVATVAPSALTNRLGVFDSGLPRRALRRIWQQLTPVARVAASSPNAFAWAGPSSTMADGTGFAVSWCDA